MMWKRGLSIAMLTLVLASGMFVGGKTGAAAAPYPVPPAYYDQIAVELQEEDEELYEKLYDRRDSEMGAYFTVMFNSSEERIHNIKKAAKRIHNVTLEPGESFSFNEVVGNSNIADDGWKPAGAYVNGQLVDSYGGGICQVSSTLYNAVLEAGLNVTEVHNHSKSVTYVPVGQDATVAYGYLDFQFVNPYDFPIKIKAKVYDDRYLLVRIVSTD